MDGTLNTDSERNLTSDSTMVFNTTDQPTVDFSGVLTDDDNTVQFNNDTVQYNDQTIRYNTDSESDSKKLKKDEAAKAVIEGYV